MLSWYLTLTLLGWLTFPLAFRLFPALADRGYSLSRALGLLVWGYVFWLLTSLGVSQNDVGGLLLGLLVLTGLSVWALSFADSRQRRAEDDKIVSGLSSIVGWVKHNRRYVISVEILFIVAFAFLAFVRASNPELTSAEKPMELMFINAILRSPTFPPRDAWLSGYAISYYYFGYVMTAMLAKLTGVPGTVAHNLMTALIFALGAIGSYGILYNLLTLRWKSETGNKESGDLQIASVASQIPNHVSRLSFLAPLFLLIISNLEGLLEILHRRGLFWSGGTPAFWTWLDIRELNQPPAQPLGWIPTRYLWWWRASRVVSDYDLSGGYKEIIDEFPMFSFIHADLHPHVLAIPFGLLAIAAALNLFLGGWRGEFKLFEFKLHINLRGFAFLGLLLGGLAFLNTWDILVAAALVVGAYVLLRVSDTGWSWERSEDVFVMGIPLGIISILLYLPFYLGFSSQLGGVLPNLVYPTRGAHLWVMFATLLLPLYAYLIYEWRAEKLPARWRLALSLSFGLVFLLWGLSWFLGLGIWLVDSSLGSMFLQMQGVPNIGTLFVQANLKRLAQIGGLVTLLAALVPAAAFLIAEHKSQTADEIPSSAVRRPSSFVLVLITLGVLLVIGPEFFYLRDQFGTRINTIFKFYYQAWMLWSLAAAYGIAVLLQKLRSAWGVMFQVGLVLLIVIGLIYPVLGLIDRTGDFRFDQALLLLNTIQNSDDEATKLVARQELDSLWKLDYFNGFQRQNPDEAAAIRWLDSAPDGVVAEMMVIDGSYSAYGRVSTLTGLPTVLGWPGHESQWRGGSEEQGSRLGDIDTLYATADWNTAREIIARYNIRYVFVGNLERGKPLREEKFQDHLQVAFQRGNVTVYEVP
jgi:YYY domain-containing protein